MLRKLFRFVLCVCVDKEYFFQKTGDIFFSFARRGDILLKRVNERKNYKEKFEEKQ